MVSAATRGEADALKDAATDDEDDGSINIGDDGGDDNDVRSGDDSLLSLSRPPPLEERAGSGPESFRGGGRGLGQGEYDGNGDGGDLIGDDIAVAVRVGSPLLSFGVDGYCGTGQQGKKNEPIKRRIRSPDGKKVSGYINSNSNGYNGNSTGYNKNNSSNRDGENSVGNEADGNFCNVLPKVSTRRSPKSKLPAYLSSSSVSFGAASRWGELSKVHLEFHRLGTAGEHGGG